MSNRFEMLGYTGPPLESAFWGDIIIDIEGIKADEKMPALREHQRDRAVGVIDKIERGSDLRAEGFFLRSTHDGRECAELLAEGYPWQASVGAWISEIEKLEAGESRVVNGRIFDGPGVIVTKSHLREISFVALGADSRTSVSKIAASANPTPPTHKTMKGHKAQMTTPSTEQRIQLLEAKIQGLKDEAQKVYEQQRKAEILGEDSGASYDALKGEAQRVDTEIYEHGLELGLLMERLEGEKLREAQARKGATA